MQIDIDAIDIESSWKELLRDEFTKPYFADIKSTLQAEKKAGKTIFPKGSLIFNAYNSTPLDHVKVVIIGQDPYHNPGEAMGLSFSVPQGVRIPPSLKRIYKEINEDVGCPIPSHGDLTSWAEQGVLLLNAMLTVEMKKAGSHRKIGWQNFTDATISKLSEHKDHIAFMLWGNFAKSKGSLIDESKHLVLQSAHPSPLAGNAFFGNHHFSKANKFLESNGMIPIDWSIQ